MERVTEKESRMDFVSKQLQKDQDQGRTYGHSMKKKVRFFPWSSVHTVPCEDRRGTWAQDAAWFKRRIALTGILLEPVLNETHRDKIRKLYSY